MHRNWETCQVNEFIYALSKVWERKVVIVKYVYMYVFDKGGEERN